MSEPPPSVPPAPRRANTAAEPSVLAVEASLEEDPAAIAVALMLSGDKGPAPAVVPSFEDFMQHLFEAQQVLLDGEASASSAPAGGGSGGRAGSSSTAPGSDAPGSGAREDASSSGGKNASVAAGGASAPAGVVPPPAAAAKDAKSFFTGLLNKGKR